MLQNKLRQIRDERELSGENGFTLIELLVVVVIIGILVAIAIPLYLNYRKGAENKSAASDTRNAVPVLEQCYTDNANTYPTVGTESAASGGSMTFTGCATGVANISSGNVMVYTLSGDAASYTVATTSNDGGATYTYDSSTGKTVKS